MQLGVLDHLCPVAVTVQHQSPCHWHQSPECMGNQMRDRPEWELNLVGFSILQMQFDIPCPI